MSWDILVIDYGGNPPRVQEMTDDDRPNVIGPTNKVRELINTHLAGIDWSDPTWGIYDGDGFSLEFSMREEESKDAFMVYVRGGGDPVSALMKFALPNNWSLLDCSTGEFIDSNQPEISGWEGFQKLRDEAISKIQEDET